MNHKSTRKSTRTSKPRNSRNITNPAEGLWKSDAHLFAVLEANPTGLMLVERNSRIIAMVNQAAAKMVGLPKERIIGNICHGFICPAEKTKCPIIDLKQEVDRSERMLIRKDNSRMPILKTVVPIKLDDKDYLLESFIDIAERKQAVDALKESEVKFHTVLDWTYDWIYWIKQDGSFVYMSPSCEQVTGYTPKEFEADPGIIHKMIHPEDREIYKEHWDSVRAGQSKGKDVTPLEFRIIARDGSIHWIEHICNPIYSESGKYLGQRVSNRNITERKLAAEAARKLDQRYQTMVDYSNDLIWTMDGEGNFTFLNSRAEEVSGYKLADLIGKSFALLVVPEELPRIMSLAQNVLNGKTQQYEASVCRKDGSIFRISANTVPVLENGKVVGSVSFGQDITEHKRAKEALQQSERKYRDLVEYALVGVYQTNLKGDILYINDALVKMLEFSSPAEFIAGGALAKYKNPEDRITFIRLLREKGYVNNFGAELVTRTGKTKNIVISASLDGETLSGMIQDITKRKRKEDLLRIQHDLALKMSSAANLNEALQYIMNAALQIGDIDSGGIYIVEPASGALDLVIHRGLTDEFVKHVAHFGADAPQTQLVMAGKPVYSQYSEITSKWDEPSQNEGLRAIMVVPVLYEKKVIAAINLASHKSDSINPDSRIAIEAIAAGIGGVIAGIQTRDKLSDSERSLAEAQHIAHLGGWEYDTTTQKRRWSDEMFNIFGREQRLGEPSWLELEKMVHPDDWQSLYNAMQSAIKDGTPYSLEFRIIRPDGQITWVVAIGKALRNAQGKVVKLQGTVQDISERKKDDAEKVKLQAQLVQAQKLESIGILTGGIAHDFNNIMTALQGYTDLARMELDKSHPATEHLNRVTEVSKRASEITRKLLLFSRKQHIEPILMKINHAVESVHNMLKRALGEDISILLELAPDIWSIRADAISVEQMIMNLVLNSRDAMPKGGTITIRSGNITIDSETQKSIPESRPGRFSCLTVADTGTGIAPEIMPHIFEPFFTTKEVGKGSGLGLAVVFGITKQHNGWVNAYSQSGRGATFKVYLPVAEEKIMADKSSFVDMENIKGNGERILVIEDELMIQDLVVMILTKNGYTVLAARDENEALDVFDRAKGDFRLVFSDVVLPGASGVEVVKKLLERKPTLKVLMTSGYTNYKARREDIEVYKFPFIQKPYTTPELLKTIKDICRE